jgi:acetolactate synthase I/II/III large subunit
MGPLRLFLLRATRWPALEAAFNGGGVHLVTVPIDYSENMRVLVDELRAAY